MSAEEPTPAAWAGLPWLVRANALALMFFMVFLSALLWPSWRHNPDLSHGLLMPLIFLFLIYESRAAAPRRFLPAGRGSSLAALLALLGLAALGLSGIYAAVLDWSHALVQFGLAAGFALLLGSSLLCFADERIRLVPLNWTSAIAVALWPLAAPIPPGTYSRITVALQLWVTTNVLHALHLLGVAADRTGNIIALANARVGIEEACSGVRSLISCIFAGIFFSASLVQRPWARVLVIALAAPLALLMNFLRSLTLTLLANAGVDISGTWHDATGVAVLVVTALILCALALCLSRGGEVERVVPNALSDVAGRPSASGTTRSAFQRVPLTQCLLAAVLSLAAALILLFYLNTRPSIHRDLPVPDLWAKLPDSAAGWQVTTTGDLSQFKDILQTDLLAQRVYEQGTGADKTTVILYLAYWRPGQAPVSQVALHTPDACWPGAGWVMHDTPPDSQPVAIAGRLLPGAESRFFTYGHNPQYAWFWHLYDGRPIAYQNPYSITELLSIAWHYGFRHGGDQVFVRVSSNRPWSKIASEPFLRQFFAGVRPMGL